MPNGAGHFGDSRVLREVCGCARVERAEEQRRLKLEAVAQQVAEGSLTIRQMTAEERKKYPKRDRPPKPRRRGS